MAFISKPAVFFTPSRADVSKLAPGTYLLRLETDNGVHFRRFQVIP